MRKLGTFALFKTHFVVGCLFIEMKSYLLEVYVRLNPTLSIYAVCFINMSVFQDNRNNSKQTVLYISFDRDQAGVCVFSLSIFLLGLHKKINYAALLYLDERNNKICDTFKRVFLSKNTGNFTSYIVYC